MNPSQQRSTTLPSHPIERRNLGSDVYRILRDRILKRELHAGEKLSDLQLSTELGVSRTPIREALHQLVQDGVVVAEPNRGFFVATFSRTDLEEIFDLRLALESFAMRRAAQQDRTDEYHELLAEIDRVTGLIAHATNDAEAELATEAFLSADRNFHSWIVNTAGNSRLTSVITGLWAQVSIFQKVGAEIPGWMDIALGQHRIILRHLLADRLFDAVDALEDHLMDMKIRVLADLVPTPEEAARTTGKDQP